MLVSGPAARPPDPPPHSSESELGENSYSASFTAALRLVEEQVTDEVR